MLSPTRGVSIPESEDDVDDDEEEEERRTSELKVSQWLTIPESPTTSSSLDHSMSMSLSHSNSLSSQSQSGAARAVSISGRRFGAIDEEGGIGPEGMALWRGAVVADDDDGDVLPEVERMALEAEERAQNARGEAVTEGPRGGAKKAGRQRTLFGRRKGKGEELAPVRCSLISARVCGR
jgi:hypothetical protein